MYISRFIRVILILFIGLLTSSSIDLGQNKIITYSGSFSLTHEYYTSSGISPRFPKNFSKAILRSTITLFEQIQLPFELYIASDQSKFQQPFDQFGVSPRITDWLTLHGGYFSSTISELTFGDQRLLGGGIELTPGDFKFSFLYGTSQEAIESDTSNSSQGTYKRNIMTAKFGYGNINSFYADINFIHSVDDTNSIKRDTSYCAAIPVENTAVTLDFGFKIGEAFKFSAELGVAAFSNDLFSNKLKNGIDIPSFLFTKRLSSQIDGAALISIDIMPADNWMLGLNARWIGPGYLTLGYAQMLNDIFETSFSPSARLFEDKITLKCKFGISKNNLRNNRESTTNKYEASIFAGSQITQNFGLDVQFNNNQLRSDNKNDSIKVSNVFNFISLSPRYNFEAFGGTNNVVMNYSFQEVEDKNSVTEDGSKNITNSINATHTISFPSSINFTSNIFFTKVDMSQLSTEIINFTETIGYSFFDNKFNTSLALGYNIVSTEKKDKQFTGSISASYQTDGWGSFTLSVSNSNYCGSNNSGLNSPDSELPNTSYNELQASLKYEVNF